MNTDNATTLVEAVNGEPVTTSQIIAEGSGNQHKNVLGLIRANLPDFEQFGRVAFETRPFETPGGAQRREVAVLNEQQATLLVTFLRNTPVVRALKVQLVKDFYAMRQALSAGQPKPLEGPELMAAALQEASRVLAARDETIAAQEVTIAELGPKASAWDHIISSAGSWSYKDVAQALCDNHQIVIGEKRLAQQLVDWGYLYRDAKGRPRVYQRYLEQGLFKTRPRFYDDLRTGERVESSAPQVRITGKGMDMIYRRLTGEREVLSPPNR